jgi:hypothetical protein
VYELSEVTAATPEEAKEKYEAKKGSVVVAASSLRELAHPMHLQEAELAFGHIGMGGKVAPEDREDAA